MFDPLRRSLIHAIDNAHNDCVNCVRYVEIYLVFLNIVATLYNSNCSIVVTIGFWTNVCLQHVQMIAQ